MITPSSTRKPSSPSSSATTVLAVLLVAALAVVAYLVLGHHSSHSTASPAVTSSQAAIPGPQPVATAPAAPVVADVPTVVQELAQGVVPACATAVPVNEIGAQPGAMTCGDVDVYAWSSASSIRASLKAAHARPGSLVLVGAIVIDGLDPAAVQAAAAATHGEVWEG